jgi:hypothetical protein
VRIPGKCGTDATGKQNKQGPQYPRSPGSVSSGSGGGAFVRLGIVQGTSPVTLWPAQCGPPSVARPVWPAQCGPPGSGGHPHPNPTPAQASAARPMPARAERATLLVTVWPGLLCQKLLVRIFQAGVPFESRRGHPAQRAGLKQNGAAGSGLDQKQSLGEMGAHMFRIPKGRRKRLTGDGSRERDLPTGFASLHR